MNVDGASNSIICDDLIAALAVPESETTKLDLLLGVHPTENRPLLKTEELESFYPALRWLHRDKWDDFPGLGMWLQHFPELRNIGTFDTDSRREFTDPLWRTIINQCEVVRLGYSFRRLRDFGQAHLNASLARDIQNRLASEQGRRVLAKGKSFFTCSLPSAGAPALLLEQKAGLSQTIKRRVGLDNIEPGFLSNYLAAGRHDPYDLLDDRQFEDLVSLLYRAEGWETTVTPSSNDGGKDVIARRMVDGIEVKTYIQAKCYRRDRPVGIRLIKEFVVTVAGDEVDSGVMVTTSHFSNPGTKWLSEKGAKFAEVSLINGKQLQQRLDVVAAYSPGLFVLSPTEETMSKT
ncbi:uncharacterized protein SOCEGT47_017120 [Sorangium cellulosum]|uniref:Restriction endonuclease type IV Mrr domain-containing protein n=1 Tax=Sorangium cellulosum TaxID=56 RepID=A0A4V0ND29_SORCE|nr:restriction endonuclease [Sorangium cellulosum]AUX21232.1 uncharacterized protein SOCEGT47_017120 [Sorangium cellulosum]